MAVLWPIVKARLLTALPALPVFVSAGVTVFDGPPTERPNPYATVGYSEPADFGGTFDQPDSNIDGLREDVGAVVVELVSFSGDGLTVPESTVFTLYDALDAWVRADQTLGVMSQGSAATLSGIYTPVLTKNAGATARLVATLAYQSRH